MGFLRRCNMKKIITLLLSAAVMLTMISCDIEAPRAFTGTVNVIVKNIPETSEATALSIFCNLNNWKEDKVNGSEIYVTPILYSNGKGTATFVLESYPFAEKFSFQFSPMKSADTKLGANWWANAISGSDKYAEEKNNLIHVFPPSVKSGVNLTLDLDAVYDNPDKLFVTGTNRLNTSSYKTAAKESY